jgi:hypothetical protein
VPQANWKKSWHGSADWFMANNNEAAANVHIIIVDKKVDYIPL